MSVGKISFLEDEVLKPSTLKPKSYLGPYNNGFRV